MSYTEVKDSGKRQQFETGAVRDTSEGKGRYDLLPAYALKRVAQHFENGARKYEDENWRKGMPLRKYLDSAIRHAFNFLEGQRDEDHAAAAAWNILALIETEEMIRRGRLPVSLNNLPNWLAPDEEKQDEADAAFDAAYDFVPGNPFPQDPVMEKYNRPTPALSEGACTFLGEPHFTDVPLYGHPTLDNPYNGRWVYQSGFAAEGQIIYIEIDGSTATGWREDGTISVIHTGPEKLGRYHLYIDRGLWVPYIGPEVISLLETFDASCEEDSDRCGCGIEGPQFLNTKQIACLEHHPK